jgi:hypothetical protein
VVGEARGLSRAEVRFRRGDCARNSRRVLCWNDAGGSLGTALLGRIASFHQCVARVSGAVVGGGGDVL